MGKCWEKCGGSGRGVGVMGGVGWGAVDLNLSSYEGWQKINLVAWFFLMDSSIS